MRSRNDEEKAQRRETLLDAAQAVFSQRGFERTSMDHIAKAAGFSRALLYVYFDDKNGIYDALRIRATGVLQQRMQRYTNQQTRGIDKVQACGLAFYHFYRDDRHYFDCLSHATNLDGHAVAAKVDRRCAQLIEVEQEVMQTMIDAIKHGHQDKTMNPTRSEDPLETALFLRGSLYGLLAIQGDSGSALLGQLQLSREDFVLRGIERLTQVYATTQ